MFFSRFLSRPSGQMATVRISQSKMFRQSSRNLMTFTKPAPARRSSAVSQLSAFRAQSRGLATFSSDGSAGGKGKSPIGWKSVAAVGIIGTSLVMYMKYYRGKQHKNAVNVRSYGKPLLGGPFDLFDYDGNRVTHQSFLGEHVLLYFGFTSCPDICPTELNKMKKALALLAAEKDLPPITPVFITIDPERDTPALMKKYAEENNYPKNMVWLTGPMEKIDEAAKQFHVYYSIPTKEERQGDDDYLVDHSIFFYLMDHQGEFLEFFGKNMNATEVAEKAARVLREQPAMDLAH